MLQDKRITLIVSGGIAAYKSCETARALMRAGAHVRVVMTEHATKFVTPLTFEALTGSPVLTTEWQPGPKGPMPHIDVNRESDLLLVMPATANLIAKAARGIADDLASTLICARRTPIAFVPAMNAAMWRNPATRRNIEFLRREGALIFGPAEGLQACGDMGAGRMLEPAEVVDMMEMVFSPKHLAGKRVLITAGPTYEAIDPVRGITNRSSGLQGFSIARAARDFGAEVTLIAGPTQSSPVWASGLTNRLPSALLQKQPKAQVSLRLRVKSASASTPLLLWQTTPVRLWNPKPTAFSWSVSPPRFPLVLPTNLPAPNSF